MAKYLSSTRLPLDHFVSGALLGAMTSAIIKRDDSPVKAKDVAKFALEGGIATAFAIGASNLIAKKEYTSALTATLVGAGALIVCEKFFKEKE